MSGRRRIRGSGGGGKAGGSGSPVTAPDDISSEAYARVLEILSEGPIGGLVDGEKSIFFDGTPLMNADGSLNFRNVGWGMRFGDPDQDWLPGFSNVETETSVGVQVKQATGPVVRTTSIVNADALQVTLRWGRLMQTNPQNGNVSATSVQYSIEYKHQSDVAWTHFAGSPFYLNNKNSSGFEKQYYQLVSPPSAPRVGPWMIRVTRITEDNDASTTISDAFFWQSFTDIIESKLIYPDSAYIGLQLPAASFNGGVPTRTYDLYGRIVRVPVNYDPTTRVYTGIWNGTFKLAWTDNPAWCLFDLLTNTRYGMRLPDTRVDFASLYTIGQYCDEMIDDGIGGTRPRYTLNYYIDRPQRAYDLINKIVSTFQTMVYYSAGGVTFSQDAPRDIDMIAVPGNVVGGIFTYQDASYLDTPNVILVNWANPDLDGKADVEVIQDAADIGRRGPQVTSFDAPATTNRSEAHCAGRWQLYSGFFNGSIVTYKAGLDHAEVMPGWIIGIRDPVVDNVRTGGRVVDLVGNVLTLDRSVVIDAGSSPTVLLAHPDNTIAEYDVLNAAGTYTTLTLGSTPPPNNNGGVWSLSSTLAPIVPWRVVSKTPVDKTTFEITAIKHHPDKYDLIESGVAIDTNAFTGRARDPVAAPTTISIQEFIRLSPANVPIPCILVGWPASTDPRVTRYLLQSSIDGNTWVDVDYFRGLSYEAENITPGTAYFRVRAETSASRFSLWTSVTQTLNGLDIVPSNVQNLQINVISDRATLTWDANQDIVAETYEVRFSSQLSGASWVSGFPLKTNVLETSVDVVSLTGTYMVKAVSYTGKYSAVAALVTSTIANETAVNVVATIKDNPTWSGTKTNTTVDSGKLVLVQSGGDFVSPGVYDPLTKLDLGDVYLCRINPTLDAIGNKTDNTLSVWSSLTEQSTLSGTSNGQWDVNFEVRFTPDDPNGVSPVWTEWQPASVGDFLFRGLQWRLTLISLDLKLTPEVTEAKLVIDMPDRVVAENNVSIPSLGTTITFDPPFKVLDGVSVAMQGLLATDTYVISDKTVNGFTIQCFASGGSPTNRGSFDYVAKGYGRAT